MTVPSARQPPSEAFQIRHRASKVFIGGLALIYVLFRYFLLVPDNG